MQDKTNEEDEQQLTCPRCGAKYEPFQQDSLYGGPLCPACDNQQYIAEYGY